jgi:hypothetical protein
MLRYVMLCYVALRYVMLYQAILRYIALWFTAPYRIVVL